MNQDLSDINDERGVDLAARYVRFAEEEARGRSPLYEAFALGVAGDEEVLGFLATLPTAKQQPNLLFGAVRYLFGAPADWLQFRHLLLANAPSVRSVMLARSTQTNEPSRCAVFLPLLAQLPQPLALIEVGASAGLCLIPDLYGYDYGSSVLGAEYPVFKCAASEATPLPAVMPRVVWRVGLDLNPLDAADPSAAAWLESLVWPEQKDRLLNLRAALRIAASHKPRIFRGDLLGNALANLCREAPQDATLVVFHTAVLIYVAEKADRQAFSATVRSLCPYWICNEPEWVLPDIAHGLEIDDTHGRFLLSLNGAPMAWTDPHGSAIEWIVGAKVSKVMA